MITGPSPPLGESFSVGSYMVEALRSMFYLRGPAELALDGSDEMPKYMLLHGIPMFFFFIFVEALILKARNALLPKAKEVTASLPSVAAYCATLKKFAGKEGCGCRGRGAEDDCAGSHAGQEGGSRR